MFQPVLFESRENNGWTVGMDGYNRMKSEGCDTGKNPFSIVKLSTHRVSRREGHVLDSCDIVGVYRSK
jgi:hypothetical protein